MKRREFIYDGESVLKMTEQEYTAFYLQFEKSIVASLKKRELLTDLQYEHCIEEIEKQYNNNINTAIAASGFEQAV